MSSLLDDLKAAAGSVDEQFLPVANDVTRVLGAAVYYLQHGPAFLEAAAKGTDAVTELIQPPAPEPEPPAPSAEAPESAAVSDQELEAQIADLQARLATRQATEHQTTVTHETGAPADVPPPVTS